MAFHKVIITAAAEMPVFFPLFKYKVIIIHAYTGVYNYNRFKSLVRKFLDHFFGIREIFTVPGKAPVTIHIIYIEIDAIAGYFLLTESFGHHPYF